MKSIILKINLQVWQFGTDNMSRACCFTWNRPI